MFFFSFFPGISLIKTFIVLTVGTTYKWAFSLRCCADSFLAACLQLKARDVASQALSFIQDLVAALLNFHSYTEQRIHIYPLDSSIEPISPLNQKVRKPMQKWRKHSFYMWTSLLCSSFLSIYMRTQCMCAPWRTALCSCTKASQRTQSQRWWVLNMRPFLCLFSHLLNIIYVVFLSNKRRLWSSWGILL